MELCSLESTKVFRKEVQIWRSCTLVPKRTKTHIGKFTNKWFGSYKIQFCIPNNTMFLVILDKFDPNHVLVNLNKLKQY
jgi:hypothetical protein